VRLGEGRAEYRDPVELFRRTCLTERLDALLASAVRCPTAGSGDPVVQL
jgi:predicted AAA+ superfamily ATPase